MAIEGLVRGPGGPLVFSEKKCFLNPNFESDPIASTGEV